MMHRRGMPLAILLYVALDLSLPAMPGAFAFDSAGAVETAGIARARPGPAVPAPIRDWIALSRRNIDVRVRMAPVRDKTRVPRQPRLNRPLRASIDFPFAPEEPH
ncbi:MAG TPA: hypothetical protein VMR23_05940 [Candidatus Limnocylindria bacterium]|nr:hypothetical protein [Candidatus Limnocylindria bacterium]